MRTTAAQNCGARLVRHRPPTLRKLIRKEIISLDFSFVTLFGKFITLGCVRLPAAAAAAATAVSINNNQWRAVNANVRCIGRQAEAFMPSPIRSIQFSPFYFSEHFRFLFFFRAEIVLFFFLMFFFGD